jgi:hypothetical protein
VCVCVYCSPVPSRALPLRPSSTVQWLRRSAAADVMANGWRPSRTLRSKDGLVCAREMSAPALAEAAPESFAVDCALNECRPNPHTHHCGLASATHHGHTHTMIACMHPSPTADDNRTHFPAHFTAVDYWITHRPPFPPAAASSQRTFCVSASALSRQRTEWANPFCLQVRRHLRRRKRRAGTDFRPPHSSASRWPSAALKTLRSCPNPLAAARARAYTHACTRRRIPRLGFARSSSSATTGGG